MKRTYGIGVLLTVMVSASVAPAATAELKLQVEAAAAAGVDVPVLVAIDIPAAVKGVEPEKIGVTMKCDAGKTMPGQIVMNGTQAELWWIVPKVEAGQKRTWTATLSTTPYAGKDVFAFEDTPGKHMDLLFAGRKVNRYMCARDASTPQRAHETYKVYHHVFDADGKEIITKGPGGKYTHHRGIYIGFSRTKAGDGKSYDTWHMKNCLQLHKEVLYKTAGPVLARMTALVHWVDAKGDELILAEKRTVTVFRQSKPVMMLMEFNPVLTATGAVELGGDPEHSGCQYRPHNNVAARPKGAGKPGVDLATQYLFHADGIKTKGQKLNNNKDLPWAAMSYALFGKRYSVMHLNNAGNPKGTIYSAYRTYGRFGAFPKTKVPAGGTLSLRYRFCVLAGEMPTRDEVNLKHAAFNTPPKVTVMK